MLVNGAIPATRSIGGCWGLSLTRTRAPEMCRSCQGAQTHLLSGATGPCSYKNLHSHRSVAINDSREVQEMVILASHLLRIVWPELTTNDHLVDYFPLDGL